MTELTKSIQQNFLIAYNRLIENRAGSPVEQIWADRSRRESWTAEISQAAAARTLNKGRKINAKGNNNTRTKNEFTALLKSSIAKRCRLRRGLSFLPFALP